MQVVVYADDDALVRDTITIGLTLEGWRVHACCDGAEAIAFCEEFQPDAVLLDLDMPNIDGFEAAVRLRNGTGCHPARIIALTGRATEESLMKARSSGFDAVLQKPISFAVLAAALISPAVREKFPTAPSSKK